MSDMMIQIMVRRCVLQSLILRQLHHRFFHVYTRTFARSKLDDGMTLKDGNFQLEHTHTMFVFACTLVFKAHTFTTIVHCSSTKKVSRNCQSANGAQLPGDASEQQQQQHTAAAFPFRI